jgi:hypothetical protein
LRNLLSGFPPSTAKSGAHGGITNIKFTQRDIKDVDRTTRRAAVFKTEAKTMGAMGFGKNRATRTPAVLNPPMMDGQL